VLVLAALAWLFIAGLLMVEFLPNLPRTKSQWLLFISFGPPLYVLGDAFVGWLFSTQHGQVISPRGFSVARVLIVLPVVLVLIALGWLLSWIFAK
jgi:hypothetical protein